MNMYFAYNAIFVIVLLAIILIFLIIFIKDEDKKRCTILTDVYSIIAVLMIVGTFCLFLTKDLSTPKVIETVSEPQIDTLVVSYNGVSDTTYLYTFYNIVTD